MLPDKCQPLLTGKQHCVGLNGPLSISMLLSGASEWYMYFFCTRNAHLHSRLHILPFLSLSLSLVDKLCSITAAAIPLCRQAPSLSLKLPLSLLLLIVLNLYVALHLPRSSSFSHAAWFFHLVAFIFYPFIFLSVSLQSLFFFFLSL